MTFANALRILCPMLLCAALPSVAFGIDPSPMSVNTQELNIIPRPKHWTPGPDRFILSPQTCILTVGDGAAFGACRQIADMITEATELTLQASNQPPVGSGSNAITLSITPELVGFPPAPRRRRDIAS